MPLTRSLTLLIILAWASTGRGADEAAPTVGYLPIDPPLVLNLESRRGSRYMQIKMQLAVESTDTAKDVEYHMPVIRNTLILFFSGKTVEEAKSIQTREQWRAQALEELQGVLSEVMGKPTLKALYFTDFVVQ